MRYFEEFEFDLPEALIGALVKMLNDMPSAPLTEEYVAAVDNAQGVYQIFFDDVLVYIGKTDADAGLQARLRRHSRKILGRVGLEISKVTFKAVRIYVFTAMDLEQLLINKYGLHSLNSWNNSGFGSNDPGRERDTTRLKLHHFDKKFPIDYSVSVVFDSQDTPITVDEVLRQLRSATPYLFRFESNSKGSRAPHEDLLKSHIDLIPGFSYSLDDILVKVKSSLGADWQLTKLPGYVIGYKERKSYPEGIVVIG